MNIFISYMFELFTKRNLEILSLVIYEKFHIRDIATRLKISPAKVHGAIQLFKKYGLIRIVKEKNRNIVFVNENSLLLKRIKSLMNLYRLLSSKHFKKLRKYGKVGIYGSFIKGEDDKESDIDLWLLTDNKNKEIIEINRSLEKEVGRRINLLLLNSKKLRYLREKDYEFYLRLKLTSVGDDIFD